MGHFGTAQKFRHTRLMPDGHRYVIWASKGEKRHHGGGERFADDEILVGSARHLELVRDQLWTPNALANEGEADMLDVYFDDQAVRTSLYLRLYNDTVTETDGLSDLTGEPTSAGGYGAITVTRGTDWSAPAHDTGTDMTTKQFSASGADWSGSVTDLVLATVDTGTSGLLIAFNALSATRTVTDGDTLDIDLNVSLE